MQTNSIVPLWILVSVVGTVSAGTTPAGPANLLRHGGFEQTRKSVISSHGYLKRMRDLGVDMADGPVAHMPVGWIAQAHKGQTRLRVETGRDAPQGKCCFHITTGPKTSITFYQETGPRIEGEMEFGCRIAARGRGRIFLRAYEYGAKGITGTPIFLRTAVTSKWQVYEASFVPTHPDTQRFSFVFGVGPGSDVWLDDVRMWNRADEDQAGPRDTLKVAFAVPAKTAPKIDGRRDDACWRGVEMVDSFLHYTDQNLGAPVQTRFALAYDAAKLYVLVVCTEPEMARVCPTPTDVASRPARESVEVFLDPGSTRSEYYQFIVKMNEGRYDGYKKDGDWAGRWQSKIGVESRAWVMETAVPFATLRTPAPKVGDRWGVNVTRNGRRQSTWTQVGIYFHSPGRFGTLIFGTPDQWWREKFCQQRAVLADRCRRRLREMGRDPARVDGPDALGTELVRRCPTVGSRAEFAVVYDEAHFVLSLFHEMLDELDWVAALRQAQTKR